MSSSTWLRRPAGPSTTSSYASVVAGQPRVSSTEGQNFYGDSRSSPNPHSQHPSSIGQSQPAIHIPMYLRTSSYAERLSQSNKAQQAKPTSFSALPTPPSSLTLPGRLPPSHRGMAFEVVETVPVDEDAVSPLPTRWNDTDKCAGIDILNDGLEVKFIGPHKANESEAAAVRADAFMPPQCGIFYYEVKILSKGKEGLIGVGFCTSQVPLNRLPGWEPDSWGYHGDDGNSFGCNGQGKHYGPQFGSGDTVGCGVNFRTNTAFFTKNGHNIGTAFHNVKGTKLHPAVGMKRPGEHIQVNFGHREFVFDIITYMKEEKCSIYREIKSSPISTILPPLDESASIQALVASYLAHDGYVETAKAFAEDAQKEARALATSGRRGSIRPIHIGEDTDAINRQKIRTAILAGNVDRALDLTKEHYPDVFKKNEMTYFRLKCRKMVEMIGAVSESPANPKLYANANTKDERMEEVFEHDMELDDYSPSGKNTSEMGVEEEAEPVKNPLAAAVEYAQALRIEFEADKRPEIRIALEESFSLVAYQDPKNSVLAHLFDEDGRIAVAEELNSAILVSLGKSSVAPLERLVQQSTALIQEISEEGGPGAFVNLYNDYLKSCMAL